MELERKAYSKLVEWKETSKGSTALLINGARRVGKSHLAEEFGKREYESYIILDFAQDGKSIRSMFEDDMEDLDFFFSKLSALKTTKLHKRRSLIILDEVQCFPLARQRIKALVADGRYDYIETGSLLSIKANVKDILIPSEEVRFTLNPLDFEEFLWAMGDRASAEYLEACFRNRKQVGDQIHKNMMNRFREYMLVGGMPGAVSIYAETKDFAAADLIKRSILDLYRDDITKFAAGYERKVVSIFDQIPSQLSKKEKKFSLSSLGKDARSRTYEDAFMWLADGMIVNQCFNATDPTVGLSMNLDQTTLKCYMADTGLLVTHALFDKDYSENLIYRSILLDKININEGMIMENAVAQALRANRHKLFFYSQSRTSKEDPETRESVIENAVEIDFLIIRDGKVCPVEVKSSRYNKHSSLDKFSKRFGKRIGQPYIIYTKDLRVDGGMIFIPIYMSMFL
ncbi:MAG: DUF4143 domain-containing protein [Candidatus Methanoplasma sp.]|jgi:predicted AAA+ superfamily ATPase|nr:DUF4143 domain-containing protein [Candidatus Methanoplasma sp.]